MTDSPIGDWHVADLKLDVESVEIGVLRGCTRAVRPPHRTDPARVDYILGRPDQVIELGVHSTYATTALGFPGAGLDPMPLRACR